MTYSSTKKESLILPEERSLLEERLVVGRGNGKMRLLLQSSF